ncbi:UBP-type zinc finger domain-containing protein [Galactobacter caseinivorans]|uniref:UBP-type domain-containing protein n=1 Tax=Galactobacter caseinivorans TaxID=2676123 RepID=A0A496PJK4_9MICC|nr:UBP-type zinc finger domain-containing protein [Galactobacter caseinivorans]RKW70683.1 hypothetical protein DWQ67_06105 [Galactobacter caseinivorans]
MEQHNNAINVEVPPSGTGCKECTETNTWWVHLRRCADCGHIGCCDTSPNQHATAHFKETGHPLMTSFEPGEEWWFNFATGEDFDSGPALAAPTSHPADQPVPGPAGAVPANWMELIHG